jgi:hypothetical protein
MVLTHDCEFDREDYSLRGPYETREKAEAAVERNGWDCPFDGGYAFAHIYEKAVKERPERKER